MMMPLRYYHFLLVFMPPGKIIFTCDSVGALESVSCSEIFIYSSFHFLPIVSTCIGFSIMFSFSEETDLDQMNCRLYR